MASSKTIERKIRKLTREIAQIDDLMYQPDETDRMLLAGLLERKRDDVVRSAVLQLHTAIEDLLNIYITCGVLRVKPEDRMTRMRTRAARALRKMLFGAGSLGFDMKLNFATAIGLITEKTKESLMELNTLRNKCSHNWLLRMSVRRGKRPKQKKPPLLLFQGGDLHKAAVMKDFLGKYYTAYVRLYAGVYITLPRKLDVRR